MPSSVAIAVAADIAATAVAEAVIFDIAMATTLDWVASYAVIQAGASFVAGSVLRSALSGGGEDTPTSPAFTAQATQRTHVIRSAVANRQIVYGRAMVSGPLIFAACSADNATLHLVVAIAGHEIDAVESVYFNDELSTDAKFSGYQTITAHLGAADQVADADLVAAGVGWTSAHRLQGVAYLYIKLTYSGDVYPRGIPNIKAVIRGKKLYDPRTATTVWSQNLALAVRDYLAGSYGLASTSAEIDDTALIAAANLCDEAVSLAAGGTEARYTCNGVLDTGSTPRACMEALLSGCGGALTWPAGRWTLHVGAYESPTVTLDEDDLAGPLQVRARVPRQDLYNAIKGTYVDPEKYWQPGDFPPVTNATYAAQDGAQIFRDIALPVTTSSATAQRLAKMMVEKSRQGITVQAAFKLSAFKLATWDNLMLSVAQMGWSSKVFKVTGWAFNESGNVNLTLQEEAAACYTWSAEETIADPAPDTNLPDPFTVAAPAVPTLLSDATQLVRTADGTLISRIKVSLTAPVDAFARITEVRFKKSSDSVWQPGLTVAVDTLTLWLAPVEDGVAYDVALRYENSLGVRSDWTTADPHTVIGKSAKPAVMPWATLSGDVLRWGDTGEQDLSGAVWRWQPGTNTSWGDANPLHDGEVQSPYTLVNKPLGQVTLLGKWFDVVGNDAVAAVAIVTDFGDPLVANVIYTKDCHADGFTGARTNATVDGGTGDLMATADASPVMWTNPLAAFWTAPSDPMWATTTYKAMSYEDSITVAAVDAGSQLTIASDIAAGSYAIDYRRDGVAPMWSDPLDPFWTADADPMWDTEAWQSWPGALVAPAGSYQFRVATSAGVTRGRIALLKIQLDVADISETLANIALGAGGTRLPLTKTYRSIKAVNLTLQADGGSARSLEVIDKDAALGPLCQGFDNTHTGAAAHADAIVQGY